MWMPSIALTLTRASKIRSTAKPIAIPALLLLAALVTPLLRAQSDSELPAGPMQAKATTACTECHEARIIVQQRLSKAAWTKEVDKMTKWGALVDPLDRDALIDYLSTNFGVDKLPYVADRLPSETAKKSHSSR